MHPIELGVFLAVLHIFIHAAKPAAITLGMERTFYKNPLVVWRLEIGKVLRTIWQVIHFLGFGTQTFP